MKKDFIKRDKKFNYKIIFISKISLIVS